MLNKIYALTTAILLLMSLSAYAEGYPPVYSPDGHNLTTKRMNNWADLSGWYAGAGIGSSDYKGEFGSSSDSSYRLYAGYQFHPYWSVEGAWVNLGKFEQPSEQFEVDGLQAAVVGALPVYRNFSLLGKAGLIRWDGKQVGNGTEGMYGLGVKYDINDRLALRGEMERYNDVHNKEISNYTAGIQYQLQRKRPEDYYE